MPPKKMQTMSGSRLGAVVGNTRTTASCYWCFTLNNYNNYNILELKKEIEIKCLDWRVQSEVGENGTPHLQGFIRSNKPIRPMEAFTCKAIHWEKARSKEHARDYCSKPDSSTGDIVWDKIPELKLCEPYGWQLDIINIINEEPDERTINWYWEPYGKMGKSALVKYLCAKKNALSVSGKSNDCKYAIIAYKEEYHSWPSIVIFDVPRTNIDYLNYEAIESIKNGCFFSGKYESKQVLMNSPHIIIFANSPPNRNKLSMDRWNIIEIKTEMASDDHRI